jgi:SOS-response transcriptional repressor LexA
MVVQAEVANGHAENIGVLLLDAGRDRVYLRFRRDFRELASEEDAEFLEAIADDLAVKAHEMRGGLLDWLEENASNFIRVTDRQPVMVEDFEKALTRLYSRHVAPKVLPFRTHLPQYSLRAAAGKWGEHMEVEPEEWVEAPEGLRITDDMFVAHVTGRSMEPRIPDGSLCVFRGNVAGSRQNKLVLVMHYGEAGENRFTIKRYKSTKRQAEEGWTHNEITLEPLNPEYDAWKLEEGSPIKVIGEFVTVLE